MSPAHVAAALGQPLVRRTVHSLVFDLWLGDGWQVNVSYSEASNAIAIIHVRRQHLFDRRMISGEPGPVDPLAVDSMVLTQLLGVPTGAVELQQAIGAFCWDAAAFDFSDCHELPELIQPHGVAFYFARVSNENSARRDVSKGKRSVLSGFRLNRLGDMSSRGYRGALPFGIQFHDSPFAAEQRVGRAPDDQIINDDTGAFVWHMPNHQLRVMFSLIDFQVYRVSCHLN